MRAAQLTASSSRRSDRVSITLAVEVSGTDLTGRCFSEEAQTATVSRHGCSIVLKRSLGHRQKIHLRRAGNDAEADGRIVGQVGIEPEGHVYGVEVHGPNDGLWGIRFPPQAELHEATARVLLECGACHSREEVALNEVDLSAFEISQRLARQCRVYLANPLWGNHSKALCF